MHAWAAVAAGRGRGRVGSADTHSVVFWPRCHCPAEPLMRLCRPRNEGRRCFEKTVGNSCAKRNLTDRENSWADFEKQNVPNYPGTWVLSLKLTKLKRDCGCELAAHGPRWGTAWRRCWARRMTMHC